MLTAAKATLLRLLANPEVQAVLVLVAIEVVAKGTTGIYDHVMDKAARHVVAEIKKQKTTLTKEN